MYVCMYVLEGRKTAAMRAGANRSKTRSEKLSSPLASRRMSSGNLYERIGVAKDASDTDIKKAYLPQEGLQSLPVTSSWWPRRWQTPHPRPR